MKNIEFEQGIEFELVQKICRFEKRLQSFLNIQKILTTLINKDLNSA